VEIFDPGSTTTAAVFACSPRAGGNSDHAAQYIASGIQQAGGAARIVTLRQYRVLACLGCGRCQYAPQGHCFQSKDDHSGSLYQVLLSAPLVVFCSPIYFYHLPSGFKALIDRSQSYYVRMHQNDSELAVLHERPACACLVAGRPTGEKLFSGALLTLKYFMEPFRRTMQEPMTLRGMDAPDDLQETPGMREKLQAYGAWAWAKALEYANAPELS